MNAPCISYSLLFSKEFTCARRLPICQFIRFAGHSHWQNVKHVKLGKAMEKSKTKAYYSRMVWCAVRQGGGIKDPKLNSKLASVLAEAKSHSVPSAVLQKILTAEETGEPFFVELQAPGGIFVIAESVAAKMRVEREAIQAVARKFGFKVVPNIGTVIKQMFRHYGSVVASGGKDSPLTDIDKATEIGIDVGANEVHQLDFDDEMYEFECEPHRVTALRQQLEERYGVQVLEAEDILSALDPIAVDKEVQQQISTMSEKLRQRLEYVERIFDNTITDTENIVAASR